MPFINADRIKETTITIGTGNIALAGAVSGFRAFYPTLSVGDTFKYFIVSTSGTEWESGLGTLTASSTLERTTVQSSSNANAAVVFTAGLKEVGIGPTAGGETPWNPVTNTLDISVNALNDVAITSPTVNQVLKYSGTEWTNQADAVNVGTVTSVAATGGTGISVTGSPITGAGTLGITNTAPDQTVSITAGTGISATGTYPNFTIALGSFTSAQLATALSDETGTGANVFATSPTLVTPLSNTLSAVPVASGLTASVTAASSSGGILTYIATNSFTVGRTVSVTGLGVSSGTTLNIAGMTIATASSSQFTVVNATVGVSAGTGTATAGGNTLADAASNAVTAGPGGNRVITAGSGAGVGKGGDIILQPGVQGSSGGDGNIRPDGVITQGPTKTAIEFLNTIPQAATVATSFNNAKYRFRMDRSGVESYIIMSRGKLTVPSITNVPTIQIGESTDNQPESSGFLNEGIGNVIGSGGIGLFAAHLPRLWCFQSMTGITTSLGFGPVATSTDVAIGRAGKGILQIADGSNSAALNTSGGSLSFPSNTTGGSPTTIATNQNDLILTGSAFQRINCTSASNLTGIAPPTGGTHVDGRMIRVYNVGAAALTLKHNVTSTATNLFFSTTGLDIVLITNAYAELIYDIIDNGRGGAGWRVR